MLGAKGGLIQKALGIDSLPMEQGAETCDHEAGMLENEKYAFRCFLLRLGFIEKEYQTAWRILLKNLEGDCAWKTKKYLQS